MVAKMQQTISRIRKNKKLGWVLFGELFIPGTTFVLLVVLAAKYLKKKRVAKMTAKTKGENMFKESEMSPKNDLEQNNCILDASCIVPGCNYFGTISDDGYCPKHKN